MKRHSKFLLLSIFIHSVVLIAAVFSYKAMSTKVVSAHCEKIPICLNCITNKPKEQTSKKQIEKKTVKKKVPKKVVKKKVVKEKIIPKKKIEPKIEQEPQEIMQEHKPEEKQIAKTKEVTTQTKPQEVSKKEECSQHAVTQKNYINENIDKISQLISENLYYPRHARKRGIQGEVIIKFTLLKDSSIRSIEIIKSNHEILARAAKQTINSLSGKFPKPSNDLVLTVPISYTLH
jgi:protein TonB